VTIGFGPSYQFDCLGVKFDAPPPIFSLGNFSMHFFGLLPYLSCLEAPKVSPFLWFRVCFFVAFIDQFLRSFPEPECDVACCFFSEFLVSQHVSFLGASRCLFSERRPRPPVFPGLQIPCFPSSWRGGLFSFWLPSTILAPALPGPLLMFFFLWQIGSKRRDCFRLPLGYMYPGETGLRPGFFFFFFFSHFLPAKPSPRPFQGSFLSQRPPLKTNLDSRTVLQRHLLFFSPSPLRVPSGVFR